MGAKTFRGSHDRLDGHRLSHYGAFPAGPQVVGGPPAFAGADKKKAAASEDAAA